MGNGRVSDLFPDKEKGRTETTPFSYTEKFNECLPYYLWYGMSYELFWDGEPNAAKAYRELNKLKQNYDNQMAWLQGLYIYEAILDNAPVLHPFSKAKKPQEYSKEPYCLTAKEKAERDDNKAQEGFNEMLAKMRTKKAKINAQMKSKE